MTVVDGLFDHEEQILHAGICDEASFTNDTKLSKIYNIVKAGGMEDSLICLEDNRTDTFLNGNIFEI